MHFRTLPALLLGTTVLAGCQEFFTVDEACAEKVAGGSNLLPTENAGMVRMNCYRTLAGVGKAQASDLVQAAARGQLNYLALNPDTAYLFKDERAITFLKQSSANQGFTGASPEDRLGREGYVFFDPAATGIWEFVEILWDDGSGTPPTGADAVDHLMRDPEFRQLALQPSFIDGAYGEVELGQDWFEDGAWSTNYPGAALPLGGRAYYAMVAFTQPHIEHANDPVVLPKSDQTGVPLYSYAHTPAPDTDLNPRRSQVGYASTFQVGALDPLNFNEVYQNQYDAQVVAASITGPDGDMDVNVVVPGGAAGAYGPDGKWLRNTVTVYTSELLQPTTRYEVSVVLTTPETEWEVDYGFTTAADDPTMDPTLNHPEGPAPPTTAARLARP